MPTPQFVFKEPLQLPTHPLPPTGQQGGPPPAGAREVAALITRNLSSQVSCVPIPQTSSAPTIQINQGSTTISLRPLPPGQQVRIFLKLKHIKGSVRSTKK